LQGDEAWASIGVCQTAENRDFATVGRVVAEAVAQSDLRVVVIASGALSHTFHKLRNLRQHEATPEENIYSDDARHWDHRVIDALVRGDHAQVVGEMDEFLTVRPEGHFAHYQMMVHALGGAACRAPGQMYSAYENSIGTGQAHVWFERPADGWTGEG